MAEENRKNESRVSQPQDGNALADSEPSPIKVSSPDRTPSLCYFPLEHPLPSSPTNRLILPVPQSKSAQEESKQDKTDRVKANLPLPEDPPTASDWNSADGRKVNVGSGAVQDDVSQTFKGSESGLREPATAESSARVDGEELKKPTAP
jgi:hypothetical protein